MDPDANERNFDPETDDLHRSSDHAEDDKSHPHTGDGASPGYSPLFSTSLLMLKQIFFPLGLYLSINLTLCKNLA